MLTIYQDPAQMPNQAQEQAVFDALWAQFLANMPLFCAQWNADMATFNAGVAAFNSAAAGMAYAIPFTVDLGSTADADPGPGKLRFNNVTQSLATVLRLDVVGQDTVDYTKSIDTFDASTSVKKGTLRIVKLGDARKFLTYDVTARAAPVGYRNITATPIDFSTANPFVNGESVLLFFQRSGDKGDKGDQGDPGTLMAPTIHVRDERASGTGGGDLTPTSTWVTRVFNTVKLNTITGASLASNRVTLPAGTYECDGAAPAWSVALHQARLYNITDATTVLQGTSEHASTAAQNTVYPSSKSVVRGRFTISAAKTFELQHYGQSGSYFQSAGVPTNSGAGEVYSEMIFRKVA